MIFSEFKAALEVRFYCDISYPDMDNKLESKIQLQNLYIINVLFAGNRFKMNSKIVYASLSILITSVILLASISIAEGKFCFFTASKTFVYFIFYYSYLKFCNNLTLDKT